MPVSIQQARTRLIRLHPELYEIRFMGLQAGQMSIQCKNGHSSCLYGEKKARQFQIYQIFRVHQVVMLS